MVRAAYFECFAGASGDMVLGALLDAGWPEKDFRAALAAVPLGGYEVAVQPAQKGALRGTQVRFTVLEPQPERVMDDIVPVIEASRLAQAVKEQALRLFWVLAEVEGWEHRLPPRRVHFHEVGAVDSILDIVGACAGLHALGVERVYVSPINVGGGITESRDGPIPVPGPATLELVKRVGAPIYASSYSGEFLTPTGALVLTVLAAGFGPLPPMRVERIGYGAGQKDFVLPNMLRVSIGELLEPGAAAAETDVAVQIETNIDDMNPEWYGHLMDRLFAVGALDVSMAPVFMKKGRPGVLLSVLAEPGGAEQVVETVFGETSTLGVRLHEVRRRKLPRRVERVQTSWGPVRVKLALLRGEVRNAAPEYEDCRRLAAEAGVPLRQVYDAALRAWAGSSDPTQQASGGAGCGG